MINTELRVLARNLEESSDNLLVKASRKGPEIFQKTATAIAAASTLLEEVADSMDSSVEITTEHLDELVAVAKKLDESGDEKLQKQASVLDEILLSIAASKNALAQAKAAKEDEINRLREELRKSRREEAYEDPRKAHAAMGNTKEQAKAVEQQVKRYVPMEAPLQTRYPPDRPGGQMTRISDHVYQDVVSGIIYDFKNGYKTLKGNEVPGGSVENQTRELGDYRNQSNTMFQTRESLMGRYASGDINALAKYGQRGQGESAVALRAVVRYAPQFLNEAIEQARKDGLGTDTVAEIVGDVASADDFVNFDDVIKDIDFDPESGASGGTVPLAGGAPAQENLGEFDRSLTEEESEEAFENALDLLTKLSNAGWHSMVRDYISQMELVGMHAKHLSMLRSYFLSGGQPPESDDDVIISDKVSPISKTEHAIPPTETFQPGNREASMELVLTAAKEIAPHLIPGIVGYCEREGLSKSTISRALSGDAKGQTDFSDDAEYRAARTLFPYMKSLGWDDLISEHLMVMASLNVPKEAIDKLKKTYKTASSVNSGVFFKQSQYANYIDDDEEGESTTGFGDVRTLDPETEEGTVVEPAQPAGQFDMFKAPSGDVPVEVHNPFAPPKEIKEEEKAPPKKDVKTPMVGGISEKLDWDSYIKVNELSPDQQDALDKAKGFIDQSFEMFRNGLNKVINNVNIRDDDKKAKIDNIKKKYLNKAIKYLTDAILKDAGLDEYFGDAEKVSMFDFSKEISEVSPSVRGGGTASKGYFNELPEGKVDPWNDIDTYVKAFQKSWFKHWPKPAGGDKFGNKERGGPVFSQNEWNAMAEEEQRALKSDAMERITEDLNSLGFIGPWFQRYNGPNGTPFSILGSALYGGMEKIDTAMNVLEQSGKANPLDDPSGYAKALKEARDEAKKKFPQDKSEQPQERRDGDTFKKKYPELKDAYNEYFKSFIFRDKNQAEYLMNAPWPVVKNELESMGEYAFNDLDLESAKLIHDWFAPNRNRRDDSGFKEYVNQRMEAAGFFPPYEGFGLETKNKKGRKVPLTFASMLVPRAKNFKKKDSGQEGDKSEKPEQSDQKSEQNKPEQKKKDDGLKTPDTHKDEWMNEFKSAANLAFSEFGGGDFEAGKAAYKKNRDNKDLPKNRKWVNTVKKEMAKSGYASPWAKKGNDTYWSKYIVPDHDNILGF